MRTCKGICLALFTAVVLGLPSVVFAHEPHECPEGFPDAPAFSGHVNQSDIDSGTLTFSDIVKAGEILFHTMFNACDGQGRPAATGNGQQREPAAPNFLRTSGPDTYACAGCHTIPRTGGAGDVVTNVFLGAGFVDPVIHSISAEFSNERNPPSLFGIGPVEMLAVEMSADLQSQAKEAGDGTHTFTTNGVNFGVTIEGGKVVASEGVDTDLVIKPITAGGILPGIRQLTPLGYNLHHGMQADEMFANDADFDKDGVPHELTIGDITASTVYQAQLGTPGRLLPKTSEARRLVQEGERLFKKANCTSCHIPVLHLKSPRYTDSRKGFSFDMTKDGEGPHLEADGSGGAIVRVYSDLKRHNLCDDPGIPNPVRTYCNEQIAQGRPDQDGRPGQEFFLTHRLWDVGNTAMYGHRGDLTTITDAILAHGGEARASRDAFVGLGSKQQASVVKFLKTLQILPAGSERVVTEN